jgi:asparagine synthase (glutamine-hydrolysing)
MSSLYGWLYFDRRPLGPGETRAMLEPVNASEYAPPSTWSSTGLLLTHADSPALPPQSSRQPYAIASGAITFDGRLDNREALLLTLRDELLDDTSDAALALAAYAQQGAAGFSYLIGDWSLVLWDESRGRLILASDFAGVRPLYYQIFDGGVRWSTRLKPLVIANGVSEVDEEYIGCYLLHGGCPNRTPYRGIRSVPPGHSLTVSRHDRELRAFWQMPIGNIVRYQTESGYEEHLRELFATAVRSRLRTSAPVLVELSGGLDSSSIACMADTLIKTRAATAPRMITLTYDRPGSLDSRFCRAVEEWCACESIHVSTSEHALLTAPPIGEPLPELWEELHQSVADTARASGAQVLITGTMGDLAMGNTGFDPAQVQSLFRAGKIGDALRETIHSSRTLRLPIAYVLWQAFGGGSREESFREDSIASQFQKQRGLSDSARFFSQDWMHAPRDQRSHLRQLGRVLELRRLQPSPALIHLSYTHPYADRRLLEFLYSIPREVVCGPGERRRLMRRAFSPFWPPLLRARKSKDLFGGAFYQALRPLALMMLAEIDKLQVIQRGYIDRSQLRDRLTRLVQSLECNQPQLRLIIALELFLRQFETRYVNTPASSSA